MANQTTKITSLSGILLVNFCLWALAIATINCMPQQQPNHNHQIRTMFAARRAADDSRPLSRVYLNQEASRESPVVMGKFKAPAPERVQRQRIPSSSNFGQQTVSASYRVSDDDSTMPEKIVHGIVGSSVSASNNRPTQKQQQYIQRTVSSRIQVSDEGLNYPPSKLSADINGNVAEIVTAPPEAVDNDFLVPNSSRFYAGQ